MKELDEISNSFDETIRDTDLQNVTVDLAEAFTDSLLKEGLLKDIPILGTILGLTKAGINLRDRLFLKKLIYFLSGINAADKSERNRMISEIDSSDKFKVKVGEKLLYILDKCDDHITAARIAKLFASFLSGAISYAEFLHAATIVDVMYFGDLDDFLKAGIKEIEKTISQNDDPLSEFQHRLVNVGVCASSIDKVTVSDQDDWKSRNKYSVEGGNASVYVTEIGHIIKRALS